jgi:hypothetical protein
MERAQSNEENATNRDLFRSSVQELQQFEKDMSKNEMPKPQRFSYLEIYNF